MLATVHIRRLATHKWLQILTQLDRGQSVPSESAGTALYTDTTNPSGQTAVKTGTNLYAIFHRRGSTVYCDMVGESGGVLVAQNSDSQAGAVWGEPYEHNGNVYMAEILNVPGTYNEYYAKVSKWDCTTGTPAYIATYTSAQLFSQTTANFGFGYPFYMTPSGRLAFIYYNYKIQGATGNNDDRRWDWLYFETSGNTFSTPSTFYDDIAENGVPWGIDVSCVAIDGGNKVVMTYIENQNWTNRSQDDYFGYVFVMEVGVWTQNDKTQWLDEIDHGSNHTVDVRSSKLLSDARFCFYWNLGSSVSYAEVWEYDGTFNTVTYLPKTAQFNDGDVASNTSPRCNPNDPAADIGFVGQSMVWSDPDIPGFRPKTVEISQPNVSGIYTGAGDFNTYIRVWESFSSPNYSINCSIVTVPDKPPDDVYARFGHNTAVCYQPDGNNLYVSTPAYDSDDNFMVHMGDYITREPYDEPVQVILTGELGYQYKVQGWWWWSYDDFTKAQWESGAAILGVMPWFDEAPDGALFFGLPEGVDFPSWPAQIYGDSTARGSSYWLWGPNGFTDPCRAIIDIGGRLYAVAEAATALKFYESRATLIEDGANMIYVSDTPLDDANHGNILDVDNRNDAMVVSGGSANLIIVVAADPPWTSWINITLSHKNDRGVTGLVVLD